MLLLSNIIQIFCQHLLPLWCHYCKKKFSWQNCCCRPRMCWYFLSPVTMNINSKASWQCLFAAAIVAISTAFAKSLGAWYNNKHSLYLAAITQSNFTFWQSTIGSSLISVLPTTISCLKNEHLQNCNFWNWVLKWAIFA